MANQLFNDIIKEELGAFTKFFRNTPEWKNTVRDMRKAFGNPLKISRRLDEKLYREFEDLSYSGTPERINGIIRVFRDADFNSQVSPKRYTFLNKRDLDGFRIFCSGYFGLTSPTAQSVKAVLPYFRESNKKRDTNDNEFGESAIGFLKESYTNLRKNIPNDLTHDYDSWIKDLSDYLSSTNWKERLSKGRFDKDVREDCKKSLVIEIPMRKLYKVISDNNLFSHLKYRRAFLCRWLLGTEPKDYEETKVTVNNLVENCQRKSEEFSRMGIPTEEIRLELQSSTYLREILLEDEDFVERYLR